MPIVPKEKYMKSCHRSCCKGSADGARAIQQNKTSTLNATFERNTAASVLSFRVLQGTGLDLGCEEMIVRPNMCCAPEFDICRATQN